MNDGADGLKEAYRRTIIDLLAENPHVEQVVLFGSWARHNFRPQSDIDLALFGEALTMADLVELHRRLEETTIPQRVDLVLASTIDDPQLLRHIREAGRLWFSRR